ncbi:magnesium transporter MRS2 homolog, mitochondrial [Hyperolius riggenbachi]|uniref:magnesium transporter MRS2 homolog, mitochondrial n=1 Tax=Hyperolius riggenbachi TaxID=752182 RepID=UPI0035A39D53
MDVAGLVAAGSRSRHVCCVLLRHARILTGNVGHLLPGQGLHTTCLPRVQKCVRASSHYCSLGPQRKNTTFCNHVIASLSPVCRYTHTETAQATLASVAPVFSVMKFDKEGNSTSFERKKTELYQELGLQARDLRFQHLVSINSRNNKIILRMEFLKAVITPDYLLILDYRNLNLEHWLLKELAPQLAREGQLVTYSLPFEFRALEAILLHRISGLQGRLEYLQPHILETLEALVDPKLMSVDRSRLHILLQGGKSLSELETDIKVFKEAILEILDEDELIEELCLTKLADSQALAESSSRIDHSEEMELLLENYYRQAEDLANVARELRVLIDDSESVIFINLDSHRNVMMRLNLQLTMGTFSLSLFGLIGVAFGMNLESTFEDDPQVFWFITGVMFLGSGLIWRRLLSFLGKNLEPSKPLKSCSFLKRTVLSNGRSAAVNVKMLKKKWKSIRDRYAKDLRHSRESRSGKAPSRYRYHPLFDQLGFLRNTQERRRTTTNAARSEAQEEPEEEDDGSIASLSQSLRSSSENRETEEEDDNANVSTQSTSTPTSAQRPTSPVVTVSRRNRPRTVPEAANADVVSLIKDVEKNVAKIMEPQDSLGTFFRALEKEAREVPKSKWDDMKQKLFTMVMQMKTTSAPTSTQTTQPWQTQATQEAGPPYYGPPPGTYTHMLHPYQASWYPYSQQQSTYDQGQSNLPARAPTSTVTSLESTAEAVSAALRMQSRSDSPIIDDI